MIIFAALVLIGTRLGHRLSHRDTVLLSFRQYAARAHQGALYMYLCPSWHVSKRN